MTKVCSIDLDDNLIARRVQGAGQIAPELFIKPSDLGISPLSSIGPVTPQYSPALEPPRQNMMMKLIAAHHKTEELVEQRSKNFEIDAKDALADIDRLSLEREEAFRKEIESSKSKDSWDTLVQVSQYIFSASTVAWAFSAAAAGGGIPALLLGMSAVAGGAMRILNDTNLLQPAIEWIATSHELQTSIKENIDMGSFYLQMGLGLAGGAAAWHAGTFAAANSIDYFNRASSILSTASGVMNGAGKAGSAIYQKRMADFQSEGTKRELETFQQRQKLNHETKEAGEILELENSELELLRKMIQKQEVQIG